MAPDSSYCHFHKFGHCKYGADCRMRHAVEVCTEDKCDVINCVRRHPKTCIFFSLYGQCRFQEFCSYNHIVKDVDMCPNENEINNLKSEIEKLEDTITKKDREVNDLKHKYSLLEKSVQELQAEFSRIGETVKSAIEDSTQAVFASMNFEQKEHEKRIGSQFDQLNEQINILCNALKSSSITTHPPLFSNFTSSPPTPGNQTRFHQTQTKKNRNVQKH